MVHCDKVSKVYPSAAGDVRALDQVGLEVRAGEFVTILGPSGCGKTTLLLTLGGMLRPTTGRVVVEGEDIYQLSARARARFRAAKIGFVFQMFHLVPYLNVRDNILLAGGSAGCPGEPRPRAEALLTQFGLASRANHQPAQLSAGERQRAAISRALLNSPRLLLADEPTGNLDPENAFEVYRCLSAFHQAGGTVIVVTHGPAAEPYSDRVIRMNRGSIVEPSDLDSAGKLD